MLARADWAVVGPQSAVRSPQSHRGRALAWLVVALVVFGVSFLLVSWSAGRKREASAAQLERFAGAETAKRITSQLRRSKLESPVSVAIVREPEGVSYYDSSAAFDAGLEVWAETIRDVGARVSIVAPAKLASLRPDVIVIPASPCVGAVTRSAVDTALGEGRGVLLTSLTGIADGGCRKVGYGMITQLTGAARLDTLENRLATYVTVPRGGPLSADIPPGSRLEVIVSNHVALRGAGRDAYWSDYLANPEPANGIALLDGAIASAQRGPGRVVYWGFDLPLVVNDGPGGWNRALAWMIVRNSIAWAASQPLAWVEPWPRSYWSAGVLAQDVEDEFENSRYALDSLRAAGVRGTFFVVSDLARRNRNLTKDLAKYGEVGTHSENHRLLGGTSDSSQKRRLSRTQQDLTELLGAPIAGLRPPEEQYDTATVSAWANAGGTYLFASNGARTGSPEVITSGKDTLILFGRNTNDDFYSVRKLGRRDPDALAEEYIAAFRKVKGLGGLYLLSYHSQMLATSDLVPTVAKVARTIRADSTVWLTTAGDVARWWRGRAALRVSTRALDADRIELSVENPAKTPLIGVVVALAPPGRMVASSTSVGVLLEPRDGQIRLGLPPLVAKRTVRATITLTAKRGIVVASEDGEAPNAP